MNKLLENKELLLRAPEPEDLELLYKWENDTRLWEYGNTTAPYSRFSLRQYLAESKQDIYADKQMRLMVLLRQSQTVIGMADLYDFDPFHRRAGVGILIDDDQRKKGLRAAVIVAAGGICFWLPLTPPALCPCTGEKPRRADS